MTNPEPTQLDRIEAIANQILAAVTDGTEEPPPPGDLAAPSNFTAVVNADRSVTCRWTDPTGEFDAIEVHEFLADPETLAATVAPGVEERTSGVLSGGGEYAYAVRTKRGSEYSLFTDQVVMYVPAEGEDPGEDPGGEDPGGEDPGGDPSGTHPSDILDLRNWTIMLPTGGQGDPDNDYLIGETIPNVFFVRDGAVVFRTPADGVHSPNSKYARTEARQMEDGDWTKSAWPSSGDHSLECVLSIDASNLEGRKRINGMQIHDGGDDVCQLMRHESEGLGLMHDDGESFEVIDPDYVDGTKFKCKIQAVNDTIQVFYNGQHVVDIEKSGSGWYWKFGCYLQTGGASEYEEPDGAYGEVTVWSYTMTGN